MDHDRAYLGLSTGGSAAVCGVCVGGDVRDKILKSKAFMATKYRLILAKSSKKLSIDARSKPLLLFLQFVCMSVRPAVPIGTEVSRRCVSKGATAGAGSDGELGPQAVSRKAGYAGPGPRSGSFHGLSRRSGPGAWPPPARPSYRRRRQARRSQGGHSRDYA